MVINLDVQSIQNLAETQNLKIGKVETPTNVLRRLFNKNERMENCVYSFIDFQEQLSKLGHILPRERNSIVAEVMELIIAYDKNVYQCLIELSKFIWELVQENESQLLGLPIIEVYNEILTNTISCCELQLSDKPLVGIAFIHALEMKYKADDKDIFTFRGENETGN